MPVSMPSSRTTSRASSRASSRATGGTSRGAVTARLTGVLAALATALAVGVVGALPAQAAECGGSLIGLKQMRTANGTVIGELAIYYNASNGNNCARFNHRGPAYGATRLTAVTIRSCTQTAPSSTCTSRGQTKVDKDEYAYYAGPVAVESRGHCINVQGWMMWNGTYRNVGTQGAKYCG